MTKNELFFGHSNLGWRIRKLGWGGRSGIRVLKKHFFLENEKAIWYCTYCYNFVRRRKW